VCLYEVAPPLYYSPQELDRKPQHHMQNIFQVDNILITIPVNRGSFAAGPPGIASPSTFETQGHGPNRFKESREQCPLGSARCDNRRSGRCCADLRSASPTSESLRLRQAHIPDGVKLAYSQLDACHKSVRRRRASRGMTRACGLTSETFMQQPPSFNARMVASFLFQASGLDDRLLVIAGFSWAINVWRRRARMSPALRWS
jgi:hypothetical protein